MKAFDCKKCGDCCYGEGGIFMEVEEQKKIAESLNLDLEDFLTEYTQKRNGRTYAKVGADNFCIFFEKGNGCTIHTVKPARCELWPYYPANVADRDTWNHAKLACRGINRECSFEDFVKEAPTGGTTKK